MGTPSDEQLMDDFEVLVRESVKYKQIVYEYCALALQPTLTQQQAERIEEILQKAQLDSWLDFLLDEADHILAHELGLIKEEIIQHQLQELKTSLDRFWCEQVLQEIRKQNRSKEIQKYLQDKGLYNGAIDGDIGPITERAIELYKQEFQISYEGSDSFDFKTGVMSNKRLTAN
ncbi:MAG: peptidoglycan-binding protein [Symploca sp. SIO1C2]|nr:peptidoglycan-binding protein [Symploca sp. SIO1C2]